MSINAIRSSPVPATAAVGFTESVSGIGTGAWPVKQSLLTSGDLGVIKSMFGPEMAANAAKIVAGEKDVLSNDLINTLIADRQSGFLPAGAQASGSYLQAMYDQYANYTGPGDFSSPLTKENLADALEFLQQHRPEGGLLDIPA